MELRKCVPIKDYSVEEYLKETFGQYFYCLAGCGFVCPPLFKEFEVFEPTETYRDPEGERVLVVEPGIYRIENHEGSSTNHFLYIEKYENGYWKKFRGINGGWSYGNMIDWRGVRPVAIQRELSL